MFKKLGKLLKKGAMSVEYIVIGVCVIGMAALATTFVSNKMSVAMGQENSDTSGDTNAGDNTSTPNTPSDNTSKIETESDFFEAYNIHTGEYYNYQGDNYGYDNSKKCVITMDGKVSFYVQISATDLGLNAVLDLKNNTFNLYNPITGVDCSDCINSFDFELNRSVGGYNQGAYLILVNYVERSTDGSSTRNSSISNGFMSCFFAEDNCE